VAGWKKGKTKIARDRTLEQEIRNELARKKSFEEKTPIRGRKSRRERERGWIKVTRVAMVGLF